jgi:hypothetical protein
MCERLSPNPNSNPGAGRGPARCDSSRVQGKSHGECAVSSRRLYVEMGSTEPIPSSHYRRVTPLAQRKKLRRSTALLRVAQWGSPEEVDVYRCSIASVALARIRAHHRCLFSGSASITYLLVAIQRDRATTMAGQSLAREP